MSETCEICETKEECLSGQYPCALSGTFIAGSFKDRPSSEGMHVSQIDKTIRQDYYGDSTQPWDTMVELGIAHGFAAGCIIKYLRRTKPDSKKHDLESANVYYEWLVKLSRNEFYSQREQAEITRWDLLNELSEAEQRLLGILDNHGK